MIEFISKSVKYLGLLLVFYYFVYPQALAFGSSSFIIPLAALGLGLYILHGMPFKEVYKVLIFFALFLFWCFTVSYLHGRDSYFLILYLRSQMGFFFAAYFVVFLLFYIFKRPTFTTLVLYIMGAVVLQSIIAILMHEFQEINDFFFSIQLHGIYDENARDQFEDERLLGNGTGLFGAGVIAGYALILYAYILMTEKMSILELIILGCCFALTFFIGLFMARTTVVGLAAAFIYIILYMILNKGSDKKQFFKFFILCIIIFSSGASLCYIYFPDFADWAFEMFTNYSKTGKLYTSSSNGLAEMFLIPDDFKVFMVGNGNMDFWGSDVGYTRLLFYSGIIGTFLYFGYQAYIVSLTINKNGTANLLIIFIFAHSLVINYKGITDNNPILYLFFFFFMFYKYYVYYPEVYGYALSQKTIAQDRL